MGFLTKYGTIWGQIPQTTGRVFWVAPSDSYTVEGRTYPASDSHDGLSPERALRTVDYAVGLTTASVGDVIVLLPGSHSVSSTITVDVAGLVITGIPGNTPMPADRAGGGSVKNRCQITTTEAAGAIFTVTAADTEIAWLDFVPIIAGSAISASNAADRLFVHDCTINVTTADNTATIGVSFPLGTGTTTVNDDSVIRNCYFSAASNSGPSVRASGTVHGLTIESCTFRLKGTTAWDDVIESTLAGSVGVLIRDCDFIQPTSATTVMTDCIDMTGMTVNASTHAYRCYFPNGSDAFEATATPDISVAECYLADTTAGAVTGSA